jgi:multiple sugar transport system permease protein
MEKTTTKKISFKDEESILKRKKTLSKVGNVLFIILRAIIILGTCYYIMYPLLSKLMLSLMEEKDLYDITVGFIPRHFTFENYKLVWETMDYPSTFIYSVGLTLVTTLSQMISCTLVGYGFARFKFPGRGILFALVILTLLIPPTSIITPMYLNYRFFDVLGIFGLFTGGAGINLTGTWWTFIIMGITCMGFKNGLYIYMIRQYYRNVPKELEEASLIDGAGFFKTFVYVMLPSVKPILTVCTMFSVVWQWTDVFYSQWFLMGEPVISRKLASLSGDVSMVLQGVGSQLEGSYGQVITSTGIILVILPLIVLYIVGQKAFVEGVERSGIVG